MLTPSTPSTASVNSASIAHSADGEGVADADPPVAGDRIHLVDAERVAGAVGQRDIRRDAVDKAAGGARRQQVGNARVLRRGGHGHALVQPVGVPGHHPHPRAPVTRTGERRRSTAPVPSPAPPPDLPAARPARARSPRRTPAGRSPRPREKISVPTLLYHGMGAPRSVRYHGISGYSSGSLPISSAPRYRRPMPDSSCPGLDGVDPRPVRLQAHAEDQLCVDGRRQCPGAGHPAWGEVVGDSRRPPHGRAPATSCGRCSGRRSAGSAVRAQTGCGSASPAPN